MSKAPRPSDTESAPRTWSFAARLAVSVLIALHLVAVLLGPLSVPDSMLAGAIKPLFRPYVRAAYLDHGYKFFAPDPGPSHLVRYDVERPDGEHVRGTFPDLKTERPRLLYHRHFMLSEFLAASAPPADFNPQMQWEQQGLWPSQRAYAQSYAEHLLARYGGKRVTLELVEHALPSPQQVLAGTKLDDARSYRVRPLGSFAGGGL